MGQVINSLRKKDLYEDTAFYVFTDHGWSAEVVTAGVTPQEIGSALGHTGSGIRKGTKIGGQIFRLNTG